ncbi:MAG: DUF5684 domain-containing protein [Halobacteriales archaeon]
MVSIPTDVPYHVLQVEETAIFLVPLAFFVLVIAGMWMTFEKADQPGWAAIIPIYNLYILLQIIGRPAWWLVLFLIPVVGFLVGLLVTYELARAFGKGVGFTLGLIFLGFIFWPLLGFGDAKYQGPPN